MLFRSIIKIIKFFSKKENKSYTDKSELISEYIPQEQIKNLIQEDLPFIKADNKSNIKSKFQLPKIDLLKMPSSKERVNSNNNEIYWLNYIIQITYKLQYLQKKYH